MAKKAKRREWTKDDVKELKTMARNKTPAPKIAQGAQENRRRHPPKGARLGRFAELARVTNGAPARPRLPPRGNLTLPLGEVAQQGIAVGFDRGNADLPRPLAFGLLRPAWEPAG